VLRLNVVIQTQSWRLELNIIFQPRLRRRE
jgi:hypothetical protein